MTPEERLDDAAFLRRAIEVTIQIGLLVLILAWCFTIVRPFITLMIQLAHTSRIRFLRGRDCVTRKQYKHWSMAAARR